MSSVTIFCDIDGTLLLQGTKIPYERDTTVLPGVIERIYEWAHNDYTIILTTGRKESEREKTIKQLDDNGILYDKLIMGIRSGKRVLINDIVNNNEMKAFAVNVKRNKGLVNVDIKKITNSK